MTALRLEYRLAPEHFRLYSAMREERMRSYCYSLGDLPRLLALYLPVGLLMALLFWNFADAYIVPPGLVLPVLLALLGGAAAGVVLVRYCSSLELDPVTADGPRVGDHQLTAGPAAMVVTGPVIRDEIGWSAISDVTEIPEQVVVWLDPLVGLIVPASAFASERERQRFVAYVRSMIADAAANGHAEDPAGAGPCAPMPAGTPRWSHAAFSQAA